MLLKQPISDEFGLRGALIYLHPDELILMKHLWTAYCWMQQVEVEASHTNKVTQATPSEEPERKGLVALQPSRCWQKLAMTNEICRLHLSWSSSYVSNCTLEYIASSATTHQLQHDQTLPFSVKCVTCETKFHAHTS